MQPAASAIHSPDAPPPPASPARKEAGREEEGAAATGTRGLEIIFVSSDPTAETMEQHMQDEHGSWLYVPFDDVDGRSSLTRRFVRAGVPTLAIIHEPSGAVLSSRGVDEVLKADELLRWNTECYEEWCAATDAGPTEADDFAARAGEAVLGAAVSAANFLARAGARAAEVVPQLSEDEKATKMSFMKLQLKSLNLREKPQHHFYKENFKLVIIVQQELLI